MAAYQSTAHRYREVAVKTASPLQLVVMLYDAAICSIQEAREQMSRRDIAARSKSVNKCISILSELKSCLDMRAGGEIANSLSRLYDYMIRTIFQANASQNAESFREIETLLDNLRSAWVEVAQKQSGSIASVSAMPDETLIGTAASAAQSKPFNISI